MYQALYRKWRPRTFVDVVGQQHITDTLQKQVEEGRLSHAYLFTGTRGTGKTTCAKILAKAANCEHPVHGSPCNCCPSCLAIDSGTCMDVLELDAASNNGVDQIRTLRDDAVYSPATVQKRVYIVDEVHMLTSSAFNALLKILEEPPEHLMFILATTELHKVPATILSRCQRFSFKRILPQDITQRLLYIAKEENIPLTQDGAELLARLADGALRDALSLLDQCMSVSGDLTSSSILEVLGLAGNIQTVNLLTLLLDRKIEDAILQLNELYTSGKDVAAILNELSTLCRDLLIWKTAPKGGEALLSGGFDTPTMNTLSQKCTNRRLLYMTEQLQRSVTALYNSTNRRTDAELCLLRLCDESLCGDPDALSARISHLEEAITSGVAPINSAPTNPSPKVSPMEKDKQELLEQKPAQNDVPWEEFPAPEKPTVEDGPTIPVKQEKSQETKVVQGGQWARVVEVCKPKVASYRRIFLTKTVAVHDGDRLFVYCDNDAAAKVLEEKDTFALLQSAVAEVYGKALAIHLVGEPAPKESTMGKKVALESGQAAPRTNEEKMQDFINFSKQFDNVKIED